MKSFYALTLLAFILSGCTNRIGDFTLASSKNIDISSNLHTIDTTSRVEGIDKKSIIILFPTGVPNMKEAMDNAIEKAPGAVALSDVTIKHSVWYIPYIYGESSYAVEGNPVYKKELKAK